MTTIQQVVDSYNREDAKKTAEMAAQFERELWKTTKRPGLTHDEWEELAEMLVGLLDESVGREREVNVPNHLIPGYYDRWDSALPADRKLYR